jgi:hypothetical protein
MQLRPPDRDAVDLVWTIDRSETTTSSASCATARRRAFRTIRDAGAASGDDRAGHGSSISRRRGIGTALFEGPAERRSRLAAEPDDVQFVYYAMTSTR